jgi:hypothetical protein
MMGHDIMMNYYNSLSDEEKTRIHVEALKAHPRASAQELIDVKRAALWKAIHGAQKKKSQDEKDSSSLPLLSSGSASETTISAADSSNKDGSLSMLSLGAFRPPSPLSLQAQSKSDTIPKKSVRDLSLTKEERGPVFKATKLANPNVNKKAFDVAYGIALWKADNQKRGINPGGSLDAVDVSLSPETDDKNDSGEDTDSSEDGMQAIRNDLLRQEQISPPSSPKENRCLAGLMKSPSKLQFEEQTRPALDKEPLSPVSHKVG